MSLTEEEKKKIEEEEKVRAEARAKYDKTTTIEATGKKWKEMLVVSVSMIIVGFFFVIGAISEESSVAGVIGFLLLLVGLILYIRSKIGAWWYHK